MANVTFTTGTKEQRFLVNLFAKGCFDFMSNVNRYKREPNGAYTWAWTGMQVICRVNLLQDIQKLQEMFEGYARKPLNINGKLVGHVTFHQPLNHGGCFLRLHLAEGMQYDGRVVRRFAQFAGYSNDKFDMSLLGFAPVEEVTNGDIVIA